MEVFELICDQIATSDKGLTHICGTFKVSSRQFYRHLKGEENAEKLRMYQRAREEQADFLADQILAIADDSSRDTIRSVDANGVEREVENKEWTTRSKLRIDARKFIASKLKPKTYGDKLELNGNLDQTITVSFE